MCNVDFKSAKIFRLPRAASGSAQQLCGSDACQSCRLLCLGWVGGPTRSGSCGRAAVRSSVEGVLVHSFGGGVCVRAGRQARGRSGEGGSPGRAYREARGTSQEDLAGLLAQAGFPFSQATIWKIENGQRPVKAAELAALADALEIRGAMSLTLRPHTARHLIDLQDATAHASATWHRIKDAATDYLEAQLNLLIAAYEAREAGLSVTELHTSWLTVIPEEAVIQARVDSDDEEARSGEAERGGCQDPRRASGQRIRAASTRRGRHGWGRQRPSRMDPDEA